jgi:hypothetical protein
MHFRSLIAFLSWSLLASSDAQEIKDGQFPVISNLRAGVAKIDITPPDAAATKIVGHVRQVTGVRDPLHAGVLILDDGETKAAIVTLDTIGAWEDMVRDARTRIETETPVQAMSKTCAGRPTSSTNSAPPPNRR